jgi:hypothetical protein
MYVNLDSDDYPQESKLKQFVKQKQAPKRRCKAGNNARTRHIKLHNCRLPENRSDKSKFWERRPGDGINAMKLNYIYHAIDRSVNRRGSAFPTTNFFIFENGLQNLA